MEPFKDKVWLSTPTYHREEFLYIEKAIETNWLSTIGENIDEIEKRICNKVGTKYAVAVTNGTAAMHLAAIEANIKPGDHVFCSDLTFCASSNPVIYLGGIPVLIDSEYDTWNMDPNALEKAFTLYPETKVVITVNLYGTPAKLDEIKKICNKHNAILIEDAAESFGSTLNGKQSGSFGEYNVISFNGNKIVTGSTGGCFLTNNKKAADHVRKLSTQAKEDTSWYQHKEIGYNYRISNIIAGIIRGQLNYLEEHINQKKILYNQYKSGFKNIPLKMNPFDKNGHPNYWLSCILINKDAMCLQKRNDTETYYRTEPGKTCPDEIHDILTKYNVESRPIWKPLHMQPTYKNYPYIKINEDISVSEDIFQRGLCLPSDNKMSRETQNGIIDLIRGCFK